ncbi:MAG: DUF3488 and DUF4129 domain-containing transglutaminase family protein [Actinomycetota bacterium]
MAQRLGWFVGLGALVLVLMRLGRVLVPAVDTPDWRVIVPAALLGGVLVTWATARFTALRQLAAHGAGLLIVVVRVTAPETLLWGIIPRSETWPALGERLAYALDILRFGSPPVLAVAGLAALAAAALWGLGAAWAWAVASGRTWVGILPPLGFYLYISVVDRSPSTLPWNLALAALAALGLVATSNLVPAGAGHLRSPDRRAQQRWQAGPGSRLAFAAATIALVGTSLLAGVVPAGGALDWRTSGGEGTGSGEGGFSASRFVDLRQSLVSLSDQEVFAAVVEPDTPRGTSAYWRLLTLDEYTGEQWAAGDHEFGDIPSTEPDGPESDTQTIVQTIRIDSLRDDRLPSLYSPESLQSNEPVVRSGASLGTDGNLRIRARTFEGMTYQVRSQVPRLDVDRLASQEGELTPLFAQAAESGDISVSPREGSPAPRPAGIEEFLDLPGGLDPAVAELASEITSGAGSSFEAALLLEDFLRGFDYSTAVSTGHSSLDLAAWLTDPESPNYRTGYCEQFAAAMGLMGRMMGLPTRVVIGFTPGEVVETDDGPLHVVRERNAHAWVEVWIDGHGWVGFDPTPRSDGATTPMAATIGFDPGGLDLPGSISSADQVPDEDGFAEGFRDVPIADEGTASTDEGGGLLLPLSILAGLGLVVAALPVGKALRRRRRYRRAMAGDVSAVWDEITDRLADLGSGPSPSQTPLEYARTTATELEPLARVYSAAVYGEWRDGDAAPHMDRAEQWIEGSFDRRRRTRAAFSLRSLR